MSRSPDQASQLIKSTFVDRTVLVHISDGRAFMGTFACVDNDMNILLANAEELRSAPQNISSSTLYMSKANHSEYVEGRKDTYGVSDQTSVVDWPKRYVGMIMIKGKDVREVDVKAGLNPSTYQYTQPHRFQQPIDYSLYM